MAGGTLRNRPILVVDDDSLVIRRLVSALRTEGADVERVDCATATVLIERPGLAGVVMDSEPRSAIRLALIQRLQERNVPFLFYTAQADRTTTLACAPTLSKPSSDTELVGAVIRLTRSS